MRDHFWPDFNLARPGQTFGAIGTWTIGGPGYSALRAFDPLTGQQKWEYRYPDSVFGLTGVSPARTTRGVGLSGGVLSAASGLVFTGDNEGNFIAFDSLAGKLCGITRRVLQSGDPPPSPPMLDGRQHVLIASGQALVDFALPR